MLQKRLPAGLRPDPLEELTIIQIAIINRYNSINTYCTPPGPLGGLDLRSSGTDKKREGRDRRRDERGGRGDRGMNGSEGGKGRGKEGRKREGKGKGRRETSPPRSLLEVGACGSTY